MKEYIIEFCEKLQLNNDITMNILQNYDILQTNTLYKKLVCNYYIEHFNWIQMRDYLIDIGKQTNIHKYTVFLVFIINLSKFAREKYLKKYGNEEIFWANFVDVKYKIIECYNVYSIYGIFCFEWFEGWFTMIRIALGRLQYQVDRFSQKDMTFKCVNIKHGQKVIGVHIPSSGKLNIDECLDSLNKAYDFFNNQFEDNIVIFTCLSWLMYDRNEEIFNEDYNIIKFKKLFNIIESFEDKEFSDRWRVFNSMESLSLLKPKTSMQKAIKSWVDKGNSMGMGWGLILMKDRFI